MAKKKKIQIRLKNEYLVEEYKTKDDLPKHLRVDASSCCQLNCCGCSLRLRHDEFKETCGFGNLSFENFKKLVDDNNIEEIELSNNGEIFLNPELVQIIKYAYEKGVKLTANNGVNLNYLSDEQAEALVKYDFETITVSLDGASQETYVQYRQNGNFEKVLENVKKINFFREKYKKENPRLIWKFIIFGHNEHEIPKVKSDFKKMGFDEFYFDTNCVENYSEIKDLDFVKKETGIEHLDKYTDPVVLLQDFQKGIADWFFCDFLWKSPQINWDGQVLGCCSIFENNFGGNVFEEGLLKALNHPKMIYAKNMITGKAPELEGLPCCDCFCYKAMKEANIWFTSPRVQN